MLGKTLAHYKITAPLGKGGMGEVYRATDSQLGREVALKLLPTELSGDPERRARFEREARTLATLQHPNIASIYGYEEVDGVRFLTMELVEGEDLAQALERGALPVEDALRIARQVALGLQAAHDKGIVHRDLKPANIKVDPKGNVKVLDFGLARALVNEPGGGELADSPTITAAMTQAGTLLGSAAYMSPEQAKGKVVDHRADLWAFGCVLYEMLVGERLFAEETITETLAAVVRATPDLDRLPAGTPRPVRRLLRRCLEKDPEQRLHNVADARLELEDALEGDEEAAAAPAGTGPWKTIAFALFAVALALAVTLPMLRGNGDTPTEPRAPARFEIAASGKGQALSSLSLAISPDGRRIAWGRIEGGDRFLMLRELDELEAQRLPDTEGASGRPAFSPDGQSLAFFARGQLRRLDLGERVSVALCDASPGGGIAWGPDGTIVFNDGWINPLSRVPATGGTPQPATTLDPEDGEIGHWYPSLLPDGEHLLVSRWRRKLTDMSVAVVPLAGGPVRDILPRASYAAVVQGDRLLFTRNGALQVVGFDADRQEVVGEPTTLIEDVGQDWAGGQSSWSASLQGDLVYTRDQLWSAQARVVRVARDGTRRVLSPEPAAYLSASLSPDSRQLALVRFRNGETNIVLHDLQRGTDTAMPGDDLNCWPVWSHDGRSVYFATARNGPWDILRAELDQLGQPETIVSGAADQVPLAITPDGSHILWNDGYRELLAQELGTGAEPFALPGIGDANGASVSPDGRWVVTELWQEGRMQIVVLGFPDGRAGLQISVEGGMTPLWSPKGDEIFYRHGNSVMAVAVREERGRLVAGLPVELFDASGTMGGRNNEWDVDRVTGEFIMLEHGEETGLGESFVVLLGAVTED